MSGADRVPETEKSTGADRKAVAQHPALGPRVWGVLVRNEWFKARHRVAFMVTLAFFAFIHVMETADSVLTARREADRDFSLPRAWTDVFSDNSVLLLIFASIAIIMLVSSEFTWRTARQNVIDGLSKMQWFWGKVLLVVIVGLVFVVTKLVIVVGGAALGTEFGAADGAVVPLSVIPALAGLFVAYLSMASLALLCSLSIRNSGPAMAVWFFWITLGEQLIPGLLQRVAPALEPVLGMLPFAAAQQVLPFWIYDSATYERMVAAAEAADRAAPDLPSFVWWMGLNVGWTIVFVGVSCLLFRRRDL